MSSFWINEIRRIGTTSASMALLKVFTGVCPYSETKPLFDPDCTEVLSYSIRKQIFPLASNVLGVRLGIVPRSELETIAFIATASGMSSFAFEFGRNIFSRKIPLLSREFLDRVTTRCINTFAYRYGSHIALRRLLPMSKSRSGFVVASICAQSIGRCCGMGTQALQLRCRVKWPLEKVMHVMPRMAINQGTEILFDSAAMLLLKSGLMDAIS